VAIAGAVFALSTLGGYILSLWFGLFGFNEIRTTPGVIAGALEVASFVVLVGYAFFAAPSHRSARAQLLGQRALVSLSALAALALVLAVANSPGMASGPSAVAPSSGSGTTTSIKISIKSYAFSPATFTVAPGAMITVTNHDSVTHTFTALPGSSPQGTFDSGSIAPGTSVTFAAPTKPGSYKYYCAIHNYMTGTLIVK
jgi:plastocyanin